MEVNEPIIVGELETPEFPGPPQPTAARLGTHTTRGMIWMFTQTIVMKCITFLSQIVLAKYLTQADFGVAGETASATGFASPISQVGVREVLVRNAANFDQLYSAGIWIGTIFGLLCSSVMVLTIPLAQSFFYGPNAAQSHPRESRELAGSIILVALSAIIGSVSFAPMARLQSQLRFRLISALTFLTSAALVLLSVFFAWKRFGVYSFFLAWPIVQALRLGILLVCAKPPKNWSPGFRHWKALLGGGTTLLGVRACATFIAYGDYLMLGHFGGAGVIGVYYFAFNLSMQTVTLLSCNMESVLFPALSSIQHDIERQRKAFLSGISLLAMVGIPLCFLQAGLAGPGVRLIFQPKWYPAIPVIQLLSLGMALRLFTSPSSSLMQAQGKYSKYLFVTLAGAVVFMIAVTIAAKYGNERTVAAAVGGYFAIEGPVMIYASLAGGQRAARDVARALIFPVLAGATAVGAGMLVTSALPPVRHGDLVSLICTTAVTTVIYGLLVYQFAPHLWQLLFQRIKPQWARRINPSV